MKSFSRILFALTLIAVLTAGTVWGQGINPGTLTWSVQYVIDQSQTVGGYSQLSDPRNNRGLALSPDGLYLYAGYNNPNGTNLNKHDKQVRKIRLSEADYTNATVAILQGNRGKALATDDKGRVYMAEGSDSDTKDGPGIHIYDASLTTWLASIGLGGIIGLAKPEGVATRRESGTLVLYVTDRTNKTLTRCEITEGPGVSITSIAKAGLGGSGEITISAATNLRGVEVDPSGRIWMTDIGANKVFRVNRDGTGLSSATVTTPIDIAFDGMQAFVTQHTTRTITVLKQSDMSYVATVGPTWSPLKLDADGQDANGALSGIDVRAAARLFYVANEGGQTGNEKSTYGRTDGESGYIGSDFYTDLTHDDNDPILKGASPCPQIQIMPLSLPNGIVGSGYSGTQLVASGGRSPYRFSIVSGTLPSGITLSPYGFLSGGPIMAGTFDFAVGVTDYYDCKGLRAYTITCTCPTIAWSPTSLPDGNVGVSYNQRIEASGGNLIYIFQISSGALPPGLALSTAGFISGTPTTMGVFSFGVVAHCSNCWDIRQYTINVSCPTITMSPASVPSGTVGTAYTQTLAATGGASPYSFSISAGTLPTGLVLTSAGVLSGTPTVPSSSNFSVRATDANGCASTQDYVIDVACGAITLSPTFLSAGTVAVAYGQSVTASGGTSPYDFSVSSGTLPTGLAFTSAGSLSGTPSATGTFDFTVSVSDVYSCTGTHDYSLAILGPQDLKHDVLTDLIALREMVTDRQDQHKLDAAITHLSRSLDPELWVDAAHLQAHRGEVVFNQEKNAVEKLSEMIGRSTVPDATLMDLISRIITGDRLLAAVAIGDAISAGGNQPDITKANQEIASGDNDVADYKFNSGIEHYRNAWGHALKAIGLHKGGGAMFAGIPKEFVLDQNYPNPFNPTTAIVVAIPVDADVSLSVYNTLGQRVALLVDGRIEAGYHQVVLDATALSSGIYFYRLKANEFTATRKLVVMK